MSPGDWTDNLGDIAIKDPLRPHAEAMWAEDEKRKWVRVRLEVLEVFAEAQRLVRPASSCLAFGCYSYFDPRAKAEKVAARCRELRTNPALAPKLAALRARKSEYDKRRRASCPDVREKNRAACRALYARKASDPEWMEKRRASRRKTSKVRFRVED